MALRHARGEEGDRDNIDTVRVSSSRCPAVPPNVAGGARPWDWSDWKAVLSGTAEP